MSAPARASGGQHGHDRRGGRPRECLPHRVIRWCGGGDILPQHTSNIVKLAMACPNTLFIGFTRKRDLLPRVNNILPNLDFILSFDSTTPPGVWAGADSRLAYGPRLFEDVPEDDRIQVVFPARVPGGRALSGVPRHRLDCPATWDKSVHCVKCELCYAHLLQWEPRARSPEVFNEPCS